MKKVIISVILIAALLLTVGCGSKKEESNEAESGNVVMIQGEEFELHSTEDLAGIHYKENYVDFYSDAIGNMRVMSYTKGGDPVFEVRVMYDENRSLSELKAIVETNYDTKEQSKTINGTEYIYYEYTGSAGETIHHYLTVFNGKAYSIGFFLIGDAGNLEEVFMNNVSFAE